MDAELNSEVLSSVVFPNGVDIEPGFGLNVIQGSRFHHPRLQLCEAIFVNLKVGMDL